MDYQFTTIISTGDAHWVHETATGVMVCSDNGGPVVIGTDDPRVQELRDLGESPEKGKKAWLESVRKLCRAIVKSERPENPEPEPESKKPSFLIGVLFWVLLVGAMSYFIGWPDAVATMAVVVGAAGLVLVFTRWLVSNLTSNLTEVAEAKAKIQGAAWLAAQPQVETETASLQEQAAEAVEQIDELAAELNLKAEEAEEVSEKTKQKEDS